MALSTTHRLMMETRELLFRSEEYREFLREWFAWMKTQNPKFSLAVFAQRANFRSRSFVRDVMEGRRKITTKSITGFQKGLGLKGDAAEYFSLLVEQEGGEEKTCIQAKLARLRARAGKRKSAMAPTSGAVLFSSRNLGMVFVALGDPATGESLDAIVRKTGLTRATCELAIEHLLTSGAAARSEDSLRVLPVSAHLAFAGLPADSAFQKLYLDALKDAGDQARRDFETKNALFLNSIFTVPAAELPRLREELREVLLRFVDRNEKSDGAQVATLTCSFY